MEVNKSITPINTDAIMKEIRDNIEKRGYSTQILKFSEAKADDIEEMIPQIVHPFDPYRLATEVYRTNSYSGVIYGSNPLGGGLQGFVKRVVRKFVSFLFVPVVEQMNDYHYAAAASISELYNYVMNKEGITNPADASDATGDMHTYMDNQEKMIEELQTKIILLEQKIEKLESETGKRN